MPSSRAEAIRRLSLDAVTAEVADGLRRAGVRPLLFKGPALERWLYSEETRTYSDIDMLAAPSQFGRAEHVLAEQGFSPRFPGARPNELPAYERGWKRRAVVVDLHRAIWGIGLPAESAWDILTEVTSSLEVGGTVVETPCVPAQALLVALHTAQHGGIEERWQRDLQRLLDLDDAELWAHVRQLADRLDCIPTLTLGLSLLPSGEELAVRLGCDRKPTLEALLRSKGAPPVSMGLLQLVQPGSHKERALLLARELVPSRAIMPSTHRLARRGRIGLAAAYLWRPIWLCLRAPSAFRAVVQSRREAAAQEGAGRIGQRP